MMMANRQVIDQAFSPEARRRLVASLKRREADHQLALDAQKMELGKAKQAAVMELMQQVEKAEACHQHVLDQVNSNLPRSSFTLPTY
jgi:hypothetical protein